MAETIDWPPKRSRRRRGPLLLLAAIVLVLFSGGTTLSYYVDALWFDSLGYVDVFWKTLNFQAAAFLTFSLITFLAIYGSFVAFKPAKFGEAGSTGTIMVNGQPVQIPVGPALRLIGLGVSLLIAFITGAGMMNEWPTLALAWYGRAAGGAAAVDPIFGRPLSFYLFTLPAWNLITGWLLTLTVLSCGIAIFFLVVCGGARALSILSRRGSASSVNLPWRGLSLAYAALLLMLAARVYLGRFENLIDDQTIFTGVNYTDAHVTLTGMLIVSLALAAGAAITIVNAVLTPRVRWLIAAVVPAVAIYMVVSVLGWYVSGFIVKPNELVREAAYIAHYIQMTRQAYGLDRIVQHAYPAEPGVEALDA